jgi:hypothetical protein
MSRDKSLRKQLFVDARIQGALVARVILYWAVCLITVTLMLLCWRVYAGPAQTFYQHFDAMLYFCGPALVASLILLPLVVVDVVRLSNRFVGPLMRMRRCLRAIAHGEQVEPIKFRRGDFWNDLAHEVNAVIARLESLDRPPEADRQEEPHEPVTMGAT